MARRKPPEPSEIAKRSYQKHGLTTMKKALHQLGGRALDQRTSLAKALGRWRSEILNDLGGTENTSAQQRAVLDLSVKTKLMLDSIDAWLLTQRSLINARKRALYPVVRERQQIADALARYLGQLGLERRLKGVMDLKSYLAERSGDV